MVCSLSVHLNGDSMKVILGPQAADQDRTRPVALSIMRQSRQTVSSRREKFIYQEENQDARPAIARTGSIEGSLVGGRELRGAIAARRWRGYQSCRHGRIERLPIRWMDLVKTDSKRGRVGEDEKQSLSRGMRGWFGCRCSCCG